MAELHRFSRTEMLFGEEGMQKLKNSRVAIFGVGGVGGYVAEALARSGVGTIDLIDHDDVSLTNINRQIIATTSTVGKKKVEVAKARLLDINPELQVNAFPVFFLPENEEDFPFAEYDYVVDAVDTVTAKIALVQKAQSLNVPILCSMGTGNKTDPARLRVADIYDTSVCPLAKVMRTELKKRKVKKLKVVFSDENPVQPHETNEDSGLRRALPGSTAFVPPAAGLLIASEVVKDILSLRLKRKGE